MTRQRRVIPQRRRVFVGCEGESEQGYVALLSRFANEAQLGVHLDAALLGGGDPLAIVKRAAEQADHNAKRRGDYECRFVLLDEDKLGMAPQRDQRIAAVAAAASLQLIWQRPCHEALLLRHLEGCTQLQPPSTQVAAKQLKARWAQYEKAMPAVRLAERLDRAAVQRAVQAEAELRVLIELIGLV